MTASEPNPSVDWYFEKTRAWQDAFGRLRTIALGCGLTEELKWGHPCYTLGGKNIVLMHGFNEYCAYLFFKGALLDDDQGILVRQTENVQAARQVRFTSAEEVSKLEAMLKRYIEQAIQVEKSGRKVEQQKPSDFSVPEEFTRKLREMPDLKTAFEALTPGRQRGYLLYFSSAKRSKTRESRIDGCLERIFQGKGRDDP